MRYGLSLLALALAFGIRYALRGVLEDRAPFILFVPAILFSAWYGGLIPAFIVGGAAVVLTNYFFLLPYEQWSSSDSSQVIAAVIYAITGVTVAMLIKLVRVRTRYLQIEIKQREIAERELREREERLRLIFRNARGVAIISLDLNGNVTDWNEGAESVFGYTQSEIVGQNASQLFLPEPESQQQLTADLQNARAIRCAHNERWQQGKSGNRICVSNVTCAKFDENQKLIGFLLIALDITERQKAQEELRRTEDWLHKIFDFAAIGVVQIDLEGRILRGNPKYSEITGYSTGELKSLNVFHITHPDDQEADRAIFDRVKRGEMPIYRNEKRYVRKDGQTIWVRVTASCVRNERGEVDSLIGIVEEVTAQREISERIRQSEERLRLATEAGRIGFWYWDIVAGTGDWTPMFCDLIGLPHDSKQTAEVFMERVHPDDRKLMAEVIKNCVEKKSAYDIEYRVIWPDRSLHWIWGKGHPVFNERGEPVRFLGVIMDITERKQTEAALRQARDKLAGHNQQLEKLVAERTSELEKSLENMESFCYSIAHDLRAPLRAMSGLSQALAEDYGPQLDETAILYCDRINDSAGHMDQLISDLLAYGRLAHLELPTEPVDLGAEIQKVLAHSSIEIQKRHAEVVVDSALPSVCADPPVFDQVLENLISNALKFVPPERSPRVHIFAEQYDHRVRVWVEDNGIGIASEHQDRIFGAFERLHTAEHYPGTGIGLAIVRRGIEKMGGRVGVESEPGKGSRFWIELPEGAVKSAHE